MKNISAYLKLLHKELEAKFFIPYSTKRSRAKVIAKNISEEIKSKNTKEKNLGSISKETVGRFIRGCETDFKKKIDDFRTGKESSLDIFAISLGYKNFFDFCQKNEKRKVTTEELFDPSTIHPAKLQKDDIITIGWKSIGFYVDAKYLGRNYFEIIATAGTERTIGEKINAKEFSIQNIIYLNEDSSIGYKSHPTILFVDSRKKWHDLATKNIDTSTK